MGVYYFPSIDGLWLVEAVIEGRVIELKMVLERVIFDFLEIILVTPINPDHLRAVLKN
jgi:hypothetical protein